MARKPGSVRALFTQPAGSSSAAVPPQKILYLAADRLRRSGKLAEADVQFFHPGGIIFGIPSFAKTLNEVTQGYSPLASETGWVDVDRDALHHVRYPNVFSLGDASGSSNAKTSAALRKQAPVVAKNLRTLCSGREITDPATYDGYAACPVVTGYGKLMLAEFEYDNRPTPSFPFDTSKERDSNYLLKKHLPPSSTGTGCCGGGPEGSPRWEPVSVQIGPWFDYPVSTRVSPTNWQE